MKKGRVGWEGGREREGRERRGRGRGGEGKQGKGEPPSVSASPVPRPSLSSYLGVGREERIVRYIQIIVIGCIYKTFLFSCF
jgi:hypothetical protein